MDDEKLITLVQSNALIYDKYCKDYKNMNKKKYVWANISKEMGFPEDACIRRWTSLRDRYTKEKRAQNLSSGSGSAHKFRWHLFDIMEFLSPHIVPRPTRTTINILEEYQTSSSVMLVDDDSTQLTFQQSQSPTILSPLTTSTCTQPSYSSLSLTPSPLTSSSSTSSPLSTLPTTPATSTPLETTSSVSPSTVSELPKKKKKTSDDADSDIMFLEAVDAFKKVCNAKEEKIKNKELDPLQGFAKMIIATISGMSAPKQAKAMQKVTDIVMQIKFEPEN